MNTSWNFNLLFSGDDDPVILESRKASETATMTFVNTWKDRTDYLTDPAMLTEAMNEYNNWAEKYGSNAKECYYFWLKSELDQNNPTIKARLNLANDVATKLENEIQFFSLRVAKIPTEKQKEFLEYPGLQAYKHHLEGLFESAKYTLSEGEEKVSNLLSQSAFSAWTQMVAGFIAKEEREVLLEDGTTAMKTKTEMYSLLESKNKAVRDSAGKAINDILAKFTDVAEHEMNAILGFKKVNDELRGFARPDSSRHLGDDIETSVVDALVESVSAHMDTFYGYYSLKAKLLGIKKFEYHERNMEYGSMDKKYSFEESLDIVKRTFYRLDKDFGDIATSFIDEGRVDVYPSLGKHGGAFNIDNLKTLPVFILLNHTGKIFDVTTLAHELGHGINSTLVLKHQNALNCDIPTSTAEVASTFMEDFVLDEISHGIDEEGRLSILMARLKDAVICIYVQVALYKFEQDLHANFREKGYLSHGEIGELFKKHMYYGEAVEMSPGCENWWIHWSHIRYFFYVYSYASGLLISKALQNNVKKNPEYIKLVKEFLSAGVSDTPKNIFAKLGIDITNKAFWEAGLQEIDDMLTEAQALAQKLGKI